MAEVLQDHAVLVRFRKALNEMYGKNVERVVLFGSRARGDAQRDSDYDVAVFLHDMPDRFAEMFRIADLSTTLLEDTGEFIHAMPYRQLPERRYRALCDGAICRHAPEDHCAGDGQTPSSVHPPGKGKK